MPSVQTPDSVISCPNASPFGNRTINSSQRVSLLYQPPYKCRDQQTRQLNLNCSHQWILSSLNQSSPLYPLLLLWTTILSLGPRSLFLRPFAFLFFLLLQQFPELVYSDLSLQFIPAKKRQNALSNWFPTLHQPGNILVSHIVVSGLLLHQACIGFLCNEGVDVSIVDAGCHVCGKEFVEAQAVCKIVDFDGFHAIEC